MKKLLSLFLIFALFSVLSGCSSDNYPRETDMEYMVSSIGFDKNGKAVYAFAEIIVVNSGGEKGAEPQIFMSKGENAKTALYNLHAMLSKPLMLKHCGLLILGDGVDSEALSEIFEICLENKSITQAIKVVATKNTKELISIKPLSNIALGYEISEALEQNSAFTGIKYKNRFYEIESKRESKTKTFNLPYFSVEEDKYRIYGLKVYSHDTAVTIFYNDDSAFYSVMCASFKKGEIKLNTKSINIELKNIKYNFSFSDSTLNIKAKIFIKGNKEPLKQLSAIINNITPQKTDIYGIADRIYRQEPRLWSKIKDNYKEIFKKANISFEVVEY